MIIPFILNFHKLSSKKPRRLRTTATLPWVSVGMTVPKARLSTAVVRLSPRTKGFVPAGTFHQEGSPFLIEQCFFVDILLLLREPLMMRPFSFISINASTPRLPTDAPSFPYTYNYEQVDHQLNNVYPAYSRQQQVISFKADHAHRHCISIVQEQK